jgi:hypothetical protein
MRQNDHFSGLWIAKVMMRPLHAYEHPPIALEAGFDFAAVGEHAARIPVICECYLLIGLFPPAQYAAVI